MMDYLIGLVGALGVADQRKRKEIAADMEKCLLTSDEKEADTLRDKLKREISTYGRIETASGRAGDPLRALEGAISAILLKEGRFFRSYAIVVAVLAKENLSDTHAKEMNRTMRRLAGRFTNIFIHPVSGRDLEGHEVRLLSIGLHGTDRVK